jgi:phage repressor protein C with HTH and peptisase S24 domain
MELSDVDRRRRLQAARLKEARRKRGFRSARAAAERFHWVYVTYSKHESGERAIGRAARKYARAFKVDEVWLLGFEKDASSSVTGIPVVGEAAIGRWQDVDIQQVAPIGQVSAPERAFDDNERFAIRLADASMNREFPQGSYAICVHLDKDDAADLVIGDVVYIERTRGGLMEKTLRRVMSKDANGGMRLSTLSNDPKLRQELSFSTARSDEKIRLLGKVVGKYVDYAPV